MRGSLGSPTRTVMEDCMLG
ncbi:hypothetical protein E2C01_063672 [Portunus trituberculatus]|uniref:Uncharacterized protein n=1 Tax=Portunus trituberculatus TaxID=210409 RepID=A0A5B7HJN1_PORTR|nr:hypothetical protein [Portunus trituberculatus]